MHTRLVLLAGLAAGPAAVAQTIALLPGSYEATLEVGLPDGTKMPPHKDTQCITAEDLKDFSKSFGDPEFARMCKVSQYKVSGNKVTFDVDCKDDGVRMTGSTQMIFTADSFMGVMTMKDERGRMTTTRTTAKRIGDCAKSK
jgi:hypothetical protein